MTTTPDAPCPQCHGHNPEDCFACEGRGTWPVDSEFKFLESVTITQGDDTPDGQMDFLIGLHGAITGIVNNDNLTVYNYKVLVEGEGHEHYILTADMMERRDPTTHPRCPACDEPLVYAVGQTREQLNKIVWTCDNVQCDVSSVAFEFQLDFDFSIFKIKTAVDNQFFPDQPLSAVWTYVLEFDYDLAQDDTDIPVDAERARRRPKYREAVRILREHKLLKPNDHTRDSATEADNA